jgi:hypothetical protein
MKKQGILREREPKTSLVIPVKALKDQDSISTDELIIFQRKTISFDIYNNYFPPNST